ncbi:hypothetical protein BXY85_3428 [Roseivirga pacifica]|uniref:Uncharacterized protein n=1 Tax=Roseivirga pacifica TaxID=1267423 RepID=A0A1I0QLA5_9BACT|nr:hypothetical protein BXY85_3428 [Roseivirga pacifica]SEW28073.1 hypothetical protein SAMN05216290_2447 [Roseivirga pacifica]
MEATQMSGFFYAQKKSLEDFFFEAYLNQIDK